MDKYNYKLDGRDVLIFGVGLVAGIVGSIMLGSSASQAGYRAVTLGILGMGARRMLSPRKAELLYETRPKGITWRLVPMLLIGVGGLIALLGVLALLVIASAVKQGALATPYVVIPLAVLLLGGFMIAKGVRYRPPS